MAAKRAVSWRYVLAKMGEARSVVDAGAEPASIGGFVRAFREVFNQPSTTAMLLAGTAMCPTLNAHALKEKAAVDKLVVRLISRASPATVAVGDVVAFTNPRCKHDQEEQNLMVRAPHSPFD
jgi:hypothetical protein